MGSTSGRLAPIMPMAPMGDSCRRVTEEDPVSLLVGLAFWLHTALCVGFVGVAAQGLLEGRVAVLEDGPDAPGFSRTTIHGIFFAFGGLYLLYAEIYLYQLRKIVTLTG